MLELKNLSFRVEAESGKTEILKSINLTVPDKSFLVITGPNGGGKTTLAKVIICLLYTSNRESRPPLAEPAALSPSTM